MTETPSAPVIQEFIGDTFSNRVLEAFWQQASGDWTESVTLAVANVDGLAVMVYGAKSDYNDAIIEVTIGDADAAQHGVVARWDPSTNTGYAAQVRDSGGQVRLLKFDHGEDAILASGMDAALVPGQPLQLRCTGDLIEVWGPSGVVLSVTDATHSSGFVGIFSRGDLAGIGGFRVLPPA